MTEYRFQVVESSSEFNDAFSIRDIVFIKEQNVPKEIEMDEHDDKAIHFIVYHTNNPIATARIRPYTHDNTVKVERVAVLKDYRQKGIGKELMKFIENESAKIGYTNLILNAQRHAEPFYGKLGYYIISEPFYEAGIEHVTMEKKIEAL